MKKICSKCENEKDLEFFPKNRTKKDGYNSICKECQKVKSRQHYLDNKQDYLTRGKQRAVDTREYIDGIKRDRGCCKCPEKEPCCLDFHHVDRKTKKNTISVLTQRYGKVAVDREIKKCILLCSNCHRKVHYGLIEV